MGIKKKDHLNHLNHVKTFDLRDDLMFLFC